MKRIDICTINLSEGEGRQTISWDTEEGRLYSSITEDACIDIQVNTMAEAAEACDVMWGRSDLAGVWGLEWIESGRRIEFTADGTNNLMISDDGTLYAETTLPEDVVDEYGERTSPVEEDYGYCQLRAAIIDLAAAHGIEPATLTFVYDGQEDHLSDDARAECVVRTDYRG